MRIVPEKKTLPLDAQSVDDVSLDFQNFLTELGTPRKNMVLSRLSLETILLSLMDRFGPENEFTYSVSSFLGRPSVSLSVRGEQFNPLDIDEDDEFGNHTSTLISSVESAPVYSYMRGVNTVTMKFTKKEMNPIAKLLIAVLAAVGVSFLGMLLPEDAVAFIKDDIVVPLHNAFMGMMSTIELPLVFFSVACGILGIGNSEVFGKIGRQMVLYFLRIVFIFTAAAGLFFIIPFRLSYGGSGLVHLHGGIEMLLGIIPKSLIDPFTGDNSMQIIVMAVFFASVIVALGSRAKLLADIINEGNRVFLYITGIVTKLLPLFVFLVLINLIWSEELNLIFNMWRPLCAFVGVLLLFMAFTIGYISVREKASSMQILRKVIPTFLLGVVTSSSMALNGECYDCLTARLGINKRFVEFGHPTGAVIFMPSTAVNFLICAVYMAYYYKVRVSVLWLVIAVMLCAFVAIATPPVPGGAIAAYSVIFAQLGIPVQGIAIMISLDVIFDLISTAFDSVFLELAMVRVASKTNMLNRDILRKPYVRKK
jgi:Na+/H+-dicarboxylate symporter